MIQLAINIIQLINDINNLVIQVSCNKRKAQRLSQRFNSLKPSFEKISSSDEVISKLMKENINKFYNLIVQVRDFINKFKDVNYLIKAWKSNTDRESFDYFNEELNLILNDLKFGITIDISLQSKENHEDINADLIEIKKLTEDILQNLGKNQSEVLVLLRDIEARELNGIEKIHDLQKIGNERLRIIEDFLKTKRLKPLKLLSYDQVTYDKTKIIGEGSFSVVYLGK